MNLESLPTTFHDLALQKYFGLLCGDSLIKYALTVTVGLTIEVSRPVLKLSPMPHPPTQTEGGLIADPNICDSSSSDIQYNTLYA